ncbi:MarC family protein [Sedimenticola hydrogenitrophicus]|uniref:MarC family protein n=1 Tax=Sedimenticola hydrogenitrophicus TaxID=2967975 RepID=UPI0023AF3B01|nr:MarC family protein [Sedimenticola hydrogenitrophicus]
MHWSDIASAAVTLFLIMDPLGNVPVFNAVLVKLDRRRRTLVVARELLIALIILLGFLLAGNTILGFLGLTQPSLSIAGGILLFIISLRMIFPGKATDDEAVQDDPFIVPLAVPLIAGPSTIAVLLLLSSNQPDRIVEWSLALLLAWLGVTILLVTSPYLLSVIGLRGSRALERLMGMILVILATQMLLNGIRVFVQSL